MKTVSDDKKLNGFLSSDLLKFSSLAQSIGNDELSATKFFEAANKFSDEPKQINFDASKTILETVEMLRSSVGDSYDPIVIPNTVFYDSSTDFLDYEIKK
ncbi:hypothetical protein Zmor_028523 [Zophobas morio]|uniref:Uncharacterized protein n=1 Tax=Zophobas morio TaxID=2755281 RepID=A0AA38HIY3_9CUCU|nr:hypothetical protein Zmor_028523 [Zophobas morio]